jgi:hypothetical protein
MTLSCKFRTVWGKFTGQVDYLRNRIEDYGGTWDKSMNIDQLRRAGNLARMKHRQAGGTWVAPKKRVINPVHTTNRKVR